MWCILNLSSAGQDYVSINLVTKYVLAANDLSVITAFSSPSLIDAWGLHGRFEQLYFVLPRHPL